VIGDRGERSQARIHLDHDRARRLRAPRQRRGRVDLGGGAGDDHQVGPPRFVLGARERFRRQRLLEPHDVGTQERAAVRAARRSAYQSHTSLGCRANAEGVASSRGSNRAHSPVCASRKVGTPDSADTPAPVSTTTRRGGAMFVRGELDSGPGTA